MEKVWFKEGIIIESKRKKFKVLNKKFILLVRFIVEDNLRKDFVDMNIGVVRFLIYDLNGLGENGKVVRILDKEKYNEKVGYDKYVFNEYVSFKIFFD